ncbi:MAG: Rpn family recombination-promoting nuclease/putative transposase [Cyanobacteriota bacterium ELA615]
MKTDNLFYQLFQTLPEVLFELLEEPTDRARDYQFASIEVKSISKTIDAVFTTNNKEYPIYFVEVQFQKDHNFYYRLVTEIYMYLGQFMPSQSWQGIVLWARRAIDPKIPPEYEHLFQQNLIKIIYLDELEPTSLGLGIIDLVVALEKDTTPEKVQLLTTKAKETIVDNTLQRNIIELIEKVIIYKFPKKSNKELEAMFGLSEWKQTQFYKDVKLEGKLEGLLEGLLEGEAKGKLKTIPGLLKLGLSAEQIATALELDLEIIQQEINKLSAN